MVSKIYSKRKKHCVCLPWILIGYGEARMFALADTNEWYCKQSSQTRLIKESLVSCLKFDIVICHYFMQHWIPEIGSKGNGKFL